MSKIYNSIDDVLEDMYKDTHDHYSKMKRELEEGIAKLEEAQERTGVRFPMLLMYHRTLALVNQQLATLESQT